MSTVKNDKSQTKITFVEKNIHDCVQHANLGNNEQAQQVNHVEHLSGQQLLKTTVVKYI